jgi:uncharacterized membrane protein YkvA (DUF1232 family)
MISLHGWKQWARTIKRDAHALYLASRDPRVPWYAKALALAVTAYALSPLDLIPDFIPVLGYLDDLIIVPAGILAGHHAYSACHRGRTSEAGRGGTRSASQSTRGGCNCYSVADCDNRLRMVRVETITLATLRHAIAPCHRHAIHALGRTEKASALREKYGIASEGPSAC